MRAIKEKTKLIAYISTILVLILSLASGVLADDISNTLDAVSMQSPKLCRSTPAARPEQPSCM